MCLLWLGWPDHIIYFYFMAAAKSFLCPCNQDLIQFGVTKNLFYSKITIAIIKLKLFSLLLYCKLDRIKRPFPFLAWSCSVEKKNHFKFISTHCAIDLFTFRQIFNWLKTSNQEIRDGNTTVYLFLEDLILLKKFEQKKFYLTPPGRILLTFFGVWQYVHNWKYHLKINNLYQSSQCHCRMKARLKSFANIVFARHLCQFSVVRLGSRLWG